VSLCGTLSAHAFALIEFLATPRLLVDGQLAVSGAGNVRRELKPEAVGRRSLSLTLRHRLPPRKCLSVSRVRRLEMKVAECQQGAVSLLVLRINQSSTLLDEFREMVDAPLSPLLQDVVGTFACVVRPAGAADCHILAQQWLDVCVKVGA